MKRFYLLVFLISTFNLTCQCQDSNRVTIRAQALFKPEMKIFYIGVANPFTVVVDGADSSSLIVGSSKGTLSGSNGRYSIEFKGDTSTIGHHTLLYIARSDTAGDTINIDTIEFSVRSIPEPEAMIAGRSGGKINKEKLIAADSLIVILRNCYLINPYHISSFMLSYNKDIFLYEFEQRSGNKLTQTQKDVIGRLELGAIINFEYIRVKGPNNSVKTLPIMKFEITL